MGMYSSREDEEENITAGLELSCARKSALMPAASFAAAKRTVDVTTTFPSSIRVMVTRPKTTPAPAAMAVRKLSRKVALKTGSLSLLGSSPTNRISDTTTMSSMEAGIIVGAAVGEAGRINQSIPRTRSKLYAHRRLSHQAGLSPPD
eukprot:775170-Prorocentrum_minimum.AAC.1